jgi:hypothetical protein
MVVVTAAASPSDVVSHRCGGMAPPNGATLVPPVVLPLSRTTTLKMEDDRPLHSHAVGNPNRSHTPNSQMMYSALSLSVDSSSTEKGANSKLPHGLTVHELKEMTKARLEAEAVTLQHHHQQHRSSDLESPYGTVHIPSTIRVSSEYHSGGPTTTGNTTTVSSSPPPVPHMYGTTTNHRTVRSSPSYQLMGMMDNTSDAWESASVSTSASDYPTSESVYSKSSGYHATQVDDHSRVVPSARSMSSSSSYHPNHPGGGNQARLFLHEYGSSYDEPPCYHDNGGMSYYVRRRAATLSPRLEVPEEDGSTMSHRSIHPIRNGVFFANNCSSSIHHPLNGTTPLEFNRIRTTSLPTVLSPTMEDFRCHFDTVEENPRSSTTTTSTTRTDGAPAVAGLSDVFSSSSPSFLDDAAALAGFGAFSSLVDPHQQHLQDGRLRAATTDFYHHSPPQQDVSRLLSSLSSSVSSTGPEQRHFHVPQRLRAATWAESASTALFCGATSDLSDDLASILKLTTTTTTTSSSTHPTTG